MEKKGVIIDDLLNRVKSERSDFIKSLENEEKLEPIETVETINNDIKADTLNVQLKKRKFAEEMRSGLLDEIKSGNGIIRIEKKPDSLITKFFNLFS